MKSPKRRKKFIAKNKTRHIAEKYELIGLLFIAVGILSLLGMLGFEAGYVGLYLASFLRDLFGIGAWIFILGLFYLGIFYILRHDKFSFGFREGGFILFYVCFLVLYHHFIAINDVEFKRGVLHIGGGFIGASLLSLCRMVFGMSGAIVISILGLIGSILLITKWSLAKGFFKTKAKVEKIDTDFRTSIQKAKEMVTSASNKFTTHTAIEEEHTIRQEKIREKASKFYNQNEDENFLQKPTAILDVEQENNKTCSKQTNNLVNISTRIKEKPLFPIIISNTKTQANILAQYADKLQTNPLDDVQKTFDEKIMQTDVKEDNHQLNMPIRENILVKDGQHILEDQETTSLDQNTDNKLQSSITFFDNDMEDKSIKQDDSKKANKDVLKKEENNSTLFLEEINIKLDKNLSNINERKNAELSSMSGTKDVVAEKNKEKDYKIPRPEVILDKHTKGYNQELEEEITSNAKILEKTLENFKVKAKIVNACHGPAVTRYELEPAPGVKVSKIVNLADDIALALAAFSVRIEPIPGKPVIGIEVPNKELEGVHLRDVLETKNFLEAKEKLTIGLGVDIGGEAIIANLSKMPHLLVAGATGSGKSVCINTIITSILFKACPDEVKFILIDPKMVELSNYNDIPHLMVPVVTDAKKAASVLNWAVTEMENRYAKFAKLGVRDMARYNAHKEISEEEKLPFIVIIIDELADLMMVAPHDVEDSICRLAQKARAAGLHLVLATQRPSVDVITGIIKANIPSRISFAVSSQIDSRTILDTGGAEKLLGKGDMLFSPISNPKPCRVQGAFISDEEVERLLDFIRSQGQECTPNEEIINFTEKELAEDTVNNSGKEYLDVDPLLEDVVHHVFSTGQASVSSIQRKFRMGYTRAARLVDTLEEFSIVGPNAGSKAREILVSEEEALNRLGF